MQSLVSIANLRSRGFSRFSPGRSSGSISAPPGRSSVRPSTRHLNCSYFFLLPCITQISWPTCQRGSTVGLWKSPSLFVLSERGSVSTSPLPEHSKMLHLVGGQGIRISLFAFTRSIYEYLFINIFLQYCKTRIFTIFTISDRIVSIERKGFPG